MEQTDCTRACAALTTAGYNVTNVVAQYERQPQSLQARQTNTRELPPMLLSEREPSPSKYKYKRFGDETVNLYNCRSLSDCSFVHVTHAQLLFSSVFATVLNIRALEPALSTAGQ